MMTTEEIAEYREKLRGVGTAILMDAVENKPTESRFCEMLPGNFLTVSGAGRLCGPIHPVRTDNQLLPCLYGLHTCPSEHVIVIVNTQLPGDALMGDIYALDATYRKVAGILVDGLIRDTDGLGEVGLDVMARGVSPVKAPIGTSLTSRECQKVSIGHVVLESGDWILADGDGVVAIQGRYLRHLLMGASIILQREEKLKASIREGRFLSELSGLEDFLAGKSELRFEG